MISPHPIPYYLTLRQAKELGGNIKKGSKAEWVYFYKKYYKNKDGKSISVEEATKRSKNGEEVSVIKFLKCFSVFNIEQTEGIEWERPPEVNRPNNPIDECEVILTEMKEQPTFKLIDSSKAFYAPLEDIINVPDIKQYENSELFYSTVFHEVVHWTGNEKRLARKGIVNCIERDKEEYAEEELVAELASNIIMNLVGISNEDTENLSAGYLKGWLKHLKQDPNFLFRVMPKAQAAVEYILGKSLHEIYES